MCREVYKRIITTSRGGSAVIVLLAVSMSIAMVSLSARSIGAESAPATRPARKNVKLPGIVINFQERCIDIESSVCLDRGALELIACTKGTKEHESIVVIQAKPMHIHAGLLLLGANPGNPAMQKPVNKQKTRWVHLPPAGDPVGVYLVVKNEKGKLVERSISEFVVRSDEDSDQAYDDGAAKNRKKVKFPNTFLFAGSLLRRNGSGPPTYLSGVSGNVISVSTFGDELLCLPGAHGRDNGLLMWRVDATNLPEIGSKVILRLRPRPRAAATTRKSGQSSSVDAATTRPSVKR
jgi:hypothetical protein